jgi:RNA polymerase sigma-70 factor (ECF subfamily)
MTDDALYDQLIAPMESKMMRTIWRVVRQRDHAEDTLQDALAIIWRKRDRVRQHPNPQALILKICINCAYDTMRKRQRFQNLRESSHVEHAESQQLLDAADELVGKEIETEVLDAISRLPEKQAVAVLMRIVQEEPYDAIAQAMGCSESTVRIHVSRGRARLSQWLSHLKTASVEEPRNE